MSGDSRKEFLLATAGNFFGVSSNDPAIAHAQKSSAVNSFLDDGNVAVVGAVRSDKGRVEFTNNVSHRKTYYVCSCGKSGTKYIDIYIFQPYSVLFCALYT